MSGLREIIEWVKREIILNPKNTPLEEFEEISTIFERDDRSALVDILGTDTPEFLDFLGSRLSGVPDEPETDEEARAPERTTGIIERSIDDLLQGAANMLGTPIRLLDEIVRPIERPIRMVIKETEIAVEKTGIIDSIKGFFRSLFS